MMESKFLEKFKRVAALPPNTFKLNGFKMFIEILNSSDEPVKTAGGLYIAETKSLRADLRLQKPIIAMVLQCGEGYYEEKAPDDIKVVPVSYKPGNIVMIADAGIRYYSVFPGLGQFTENRLGMTLESEVQMSWPDLESYKKYSEALGEQ